MDSRITIKRLNDLLSYDWIKLIALVISSILIWSLIFTTTSVRLSAGQQFKIYLGYDVSTGEKFDVFYKKVNDEALSFDVLELGYEALLSDTQATILSARLSVFEGDLAFVANIDSEEKNVPNNFKLFVDNYIMYDINQLISDADNYVSQFYSLENDEIVENNGVGKFNIPYLKSYFDKRMKKDNRFKSKTEYEKGYVLEMARLETLRKALIEFKTLIQNDNSLLVNYARFEQYNNINDTEPEAPLIEKPYGINLSGVKNIGSIVKSAIDGSTDNLTLTVFNFKNKQKDLQYEVIPAIVLLLKGL